MYQKDSQNKVFAAVLFLIWPFISTFFAVINYKESWSKNLVWFFVAFFGFTMVISNSEIDANRYRDDFVEISTAGESDSNIVTGLYSEDTGYLDIMKPTLDLLVSKFTDNYKILFLIYGLIFGYFFSRNIWILLERLRTPITFISVLLLLVFSFINPIWYINGFRFWTAAQIFVFGSLLYFVEDKRKGLLIALLSTFVHFSFMFPVAVLAIYYFLGNRLTIYFYFFITSMFISELNVNAVRNGVEGVLPVVFELKVKNYTNEEYMERRLENNKNMNWYVPFRNHALKYSIYVFLILLYYKRRALIRNYNGLYGLFCYVLAFLAISNIISSIPSAGRFITVAFSIAIAFVYLCLELFNDKFMKTIVKITVPVMLLYIIVALRIGFDTIGLTTVFGNPILALFVHDDVALISLIK